MSRLIDIAALAGLIALVYYVRRLVECLEHVLFLERELPLWRKDHAAASDKLDGKTREALLHTFDGREP